MSLLCCYETAQAWDDWTARSPRGVVHVCRRLLTSVPLLVLQVGTHGLIINFVEPGTGMRRSATYLPEIAHREGWTKRYTLESLILKSGYNVRARLVPHRLLIHTDICLTS